MKSYIGEMYYDMSRELKEHLINEIGMSETDQRILKSIMYKSGDSQYHYDNTGIPRDKFERHLRRINIEVFSEITRLAKIGLKAK